MKVNKTKKDKTKVSDKTQKDTFDPKQLKKKIQLKTYLA
jgi:hypothetical protein